MTSREKKAWKHLVLSSGKVLRIGEITTVGKDFENVLPNKIIVRHGGGGGGAMKVQTFRGIQGHAQVFEKTWIALDCFLSIIRRSTCKSHPLDLLKMQSTPDNSNLQGK